MSIKVSRLLRFPRWYQRSLKLLFDELEKQDEITLNQHIYLASEKLTVQLDRKILKKYFTQSEPEGNIESTVVKFDVTSENDSNNPTQDYQSTFLNSEMTFYKKKGRVLVKKKKRLTHTTTNQERAAQHQKGTQKLYPLIKENTFYTERHDKIRKPDTYDEEEIVTQRLYHTQIAQPRGRLLSEMIHDKELSRFSFKEVLRLFVCVVDEVESLQMIGINRLSLDPNNIAYDSETQQITFLDYAVTQENNNIGLGVLLAQLMGIPFLKIQLAKTHAQFAEEIICELKSNHKAFSAEFMDQITCIFKNLLEPESGDSLSIIEVKNLIISSLTAEGADVPTPVQDSLIKESFFKATLSSDTSNLLTPLCEKLQAVFNLPWNKASCIAGTPGSIKEMSRILSQVNMSDKEKLKQLQKFCEKNAFLPKWKRVLRRRKGITHELICLLQRLDAMPAHQMINQLDLFIGKFNRKIKLNVKTKRGGKSASRISDPLRDPLISSPR